MKTKTKSSTFWNFFIEVILLIIILLVLTGFFIRAHSQSLNTENAQYRTSFVTIDLHGNKQCAPVDILFQFRKNKVQTTNRDQTKTLWIVSKYDSVILQQTKYPAKIAQAVDNGGFYCVVSLGYATDVGIYFLDIGYNDLDFFYECKQTIDTIPSNHIELPPSFDVPENIKYTEKQEKELIKVFGQLQNIK